MPRVTTSQFDAQWIPFLLFQLTHSDCVTINADELAETLRGSGADQEVSLQYIPYVNYLTLVQGFRGYIITYDMILALVNFVQTVCETWHWGKSIYVATIMQK